MFSFLARPRALALIFSLSTLTPFANALDTLFTSSVTYCEPPETLLVQRFEIAYFPKNNSVSFNVSAASVQANVNVTANLFLNVYGMKPVNVTLDLCGILHGALCPLPMYNFTGADSITLPESLSVTEHIPGIAYKIPDLEGFAQLTLKEINTGAIKACVQATLANGKSAHQKTVEWTTGGITLGIFILALWQSTISPDAAIPFRLVELLCLFQSIASSAFLRLNYPSVYRAYAINFAWAMGLIGASVDSSVQLSINRMRHLTGGKLADAIGGSAVSLVNRKLSPYNSPSNNLASLGGPAGSISLFSNAEASRTLVAALPSDFDIDFSKLKFASHFAKRDTIVDGIVQTVTPGSSNTLDVGLPIYANTLHIATANAFMTVFFCALILLAIALGVFVLGYGVLFAVERYRARNHNGSLTSNFNYRSFMISWCVRLALVMALPLYVFIFFQWTLKDSWLTIFLAVISFLAISASLIYSSYLTLRTARLESPSALYARKSPQLNRYGPLYAKYRLQRYYFFVSLLAAFLVRSIAISFAKHSGEAQLALLIITELALVVGHILLKPARTRGGDVFWTYLAITRLVCTGLLIAFLEKIALSPIPRVVIGFVVMIIWSVCVLVMFGNIFWHAGVAVFKAVTGRDREDGASILTSPVGSEGSMLEKGLRGSSEKTGSKEPSTSSRTSSLHEDGGISHMVSIEEVARAGRPVNPTPEHNVPAFEQYLCPYPVSPTATVSTQMDPPSIYSRDSGTITVGSLLPRRWSFSFSQPSSPVGSEAPSTNHRRQGSLTNSVAPSSPAWTDASHGPSSYGHSQSHSGGSVSRNTSTRVQMHHPTHEDIQEEHEGGLSPIRPPPRATLSSPS
ncbi:hypothetical protein D9619_001350 [Psilocybe cf. subviscida]|uniref:ML-like domain-containing protein n=1 Tax=Psilocybe cf. subviscida TaxID=2480587 RepID=A0A8H5F2R5_9AGAR|nr:hypothetical protein D9619_001350 [Psilocybe cf. subviscida]